MSATNVTQIVTTTNALVDLATTAIPTLQALGEPTRVAALRAAIQPNLDLLEAVVVQTDEQRAVACALIGAVKPMGDKLDEARRKINFACKTEIDGRFLPLINSIRTSVGVAQSARRTYDDEQMAKAREAQRLADEQAAKERAELERRRKIQQAAVEAGKQAITVIPEDETVKPTYISAPAVIREDSRMHYRLAYKITAVDLLPEDYYTRVPNAMAIQTEMLALEKTYDKGRKGLDDIEQIIPGIEFFWNQVYRDK
ncbi:MAG TPA: hypothetical protein VMW24_01840 [Sedimentisphaerales bacterium]|nr:hypothetical protein [Sedimentisphaerales bacterium]